MSHLISSPLEDAEDATQGDDWKGSHVAPWLKSIGHGSFICHCCAGKAISTATPPRRQVFSETAGGAGLATERDAGFRNARDLRPADVPILHGGLRGDLHPPVAPPANGVLFKLVNGNLTDTETHKTDSTMPRQKRPLHSAIDRHCVHEAAIV